MAKSQSEIDAEKAAKPRPDLIPAHVLLGFAQASRAMLSSTSRPDPFFYDAVEDLLAYGQTGDVDHVFSAMASVAVSRFASHAEAMLAMGRVMGYGFAKHGVCTWRVAGTQQADTQTHYASALRHLLEDAIDSSAREEGSGLPVIEHALAQLGILADLVISPAAIEGENDGKWRAGAARPTSGRVAGIVPDPTDAATKDDRWNERTRSPLVASSLGSGV